MKTPRLASSFFGAGLLAGLLAALLAAPVAAGAQTLAERAREARKKKEQSTRKVWTNDELRRLEGSFGFNVVGTSLTRPEETQPAAGQAPAPAPAEEKNFYSDLTLEERQVWIDKLEQEIAQAETSLTELRGRQLAAATEEERAGLAEQIAALEQAVEANRVEIELIRNTPLPKTSKPAQQPR